MSRYMKCPNEIVHEKDEGMILHGTREAPIPVPDKRDEFYVESEYEEIGRVLGFHHLCTHSLLKIEGKTIDRNVAREANGKHHVFYFDVSEPFDAGIKVLQAAVDDMKKNRAKLPPEKLRLLEDIERSEEANGGLR